jgi:hypothetical protein
MPVVICVRVQVNCPPFPINLSFWVFGLNWLVHATQYDIRARGLEFESWRVRLNKIIAVHSNIHIVKAHDEQP